MARGERILRVALLIFLTELAERLVDVVLVYHDAGLGAAGFGAQFAAQAVEVEFAVLEVGVGLELVPVNVSGRFRVKVMCIESLPDAVAADEVAAAVGLLLLRFSAWETVILVPAVSDLVHICHQVLAWTRSVDSSSRWYGEA